jgi:hypothetical protein
MARSPLPHQLAELPELAALDLLDTALAVARNALLAVYPTVASERFVRGRSAPTSLACLADAIAVQSEALQTILIRYRHFAVHAQELSDVEHALAHDPRLHEDDDDDIPF